jgi:hypothetical protein
VTLQFRDPVVKVKGQWKYLYCAVDKDGNTIDFLQPIATRKPLCVFSRKRSGNTVCRKRSRFVLGQKAHHIATGENFCDIITRRAHIAWAPSSDFHLLSPCQTPCFLSASATSRGI